MDPLEKPAMKMHRIVISEQLCRYFLSGWAFLIPYLLIYLLYYWQKWPTIPGVSIDPHSGKYIPPLLFVLWALHGTHLVLGIIALSPGPSNGGRWIRSSLILSTLPWLFVVLLFLIPGVYLEFPSDPWEHLRRVTDWAADPTVASNPIWYKWSYFFTYSLIGRIPATLQISCLNIYYTAICCLLSWQYFQLARAIGFSKSMAYIFVLFQIVLCGNSIFSFYRYYGISSTIYAQIGAVAFVRMALQVGSRSLEQGGTQQLWRPSVLSTYVSFALSIVFILILIAFSHEQGLGIACLGLGAVVIWRILKWRVAVIWWFILILLISNFAAIHWLHRHPAIDQTYRLEGWLTAWYGFNLFSMNSPANDRMMQILGLLGMLNLLAGLVLLRKNHIAGWLTVIPILAMSLPLVSIPFANVLARHGGVEGIITFHRMFLAIPSGLALVAFVGGFNRAHLGSREDTGTFITRKYQSSIPYALTIFVLLALLICPTSGPYYNRFWHTLTIPAEDLSMRGAWMDLAGYTLAKDYHPEAYYAATTGLNFVLNTIRPAPHEPPNDRAFSTRTYYNDKRLPDIDLNRIHHILLQPDIANYIVIIPHNILTIYSFQSLAAVLSDHWLPQEVSLSLTGARELHMPVNASITDSLKRFGNFDFYEKR